ncbi:hypothetical protein IVB30_23870 [Bradyrhizobium sp. 200]|uniref:hypothetical protein n=1 Tax=Bradyrhizobium sp. 200 TaxID=2782665 RepID=UPI001FFE530F|nr:hypothetical protein [Bradyrhizobium sp. 200]UPJ46386.1 hypothetical protein IVB30_23870 [Bradyrhizobium sp. 200]
MKLARHAQYLGWTAARSDINNPKVLEQGRLIGNSSAAFQPQYCIALSSGAPPSVQVVVALGR